VTDTRNEHHRDEGILNGMSRTEERRDDVGGRRGQGLCGKSDVAVVMGSISDAEVMRGASEVLQSFGVPYVESIVSAHRTPQRLYEFATGANSNFKVIIAGAGGAAHLPGMIASMTAVPVLGVPIAVGTVMGLDAMLSIAQMPKGVPVGTVAINGAANAALLAVRILAINDENLREALIKYQADIAAQVPMQPSLRA
jgi:phosphoribosylaminoimidazole carboxylase PurE protein